MSTTEPIHVEFWYDSDCPNAAPVRATLQQCLRRLHAPSSLEEHRDNEVCSPTVTVDGTDVMAEGPPMRGRGCRLDLATVEQIEQALTHAAARRRVP